MFCVIPKLAPPLSAIFQTGAPFERKEGHSFEGGVHQIFHVKRGGGGVNLREALFLVKTVCLIHMFQKQPQ